jgi:integrase
MCATPACRGRRKYNVGVKKIATKDGKTKWLADFYIRQPNGVMTRVTKRLPTKTLAELFEQKTKITAFEGEYFKRTSRTVRKTVAEVWKDYQPKCQREVQSWQTDLGRAQHLIEHLGTEIAENLTERDIDKYREARLLEKTVRGGPPTKCTLDHELELLKRMLNYAARSQLIRHNPIGHVQLLREPNTRDVVVTQAEFERLYEAAEAPLRPILLVAYETGMRKEEILGLRWERVNLKAKQFRLLAEDLKEKKSRIVVLGDRLVKVLDELPRSTSGHVFVNPKTNTRWQDIRRMWDRARKKSGIEKSFYFHDLRRSFITNARRRGIPESVVMMMSGHRTREVFDRYNIVDEGDLEAAVKVMEEKRDAELATTTEVEVVG